MEMRVFEISLFMIPFTIMSVLRFGSGADFGHERSREEYTTVFKNIPIVFERLIQMLEEKPEVLESDDISVFNKRQAQYKDKSNELTDTTDGNEVKKRAIEYITEESEENKDYVSEKDDSDSQDTTYAEEDDFYDDFYKNDPDINNEMENEKLTQPVRNKIFMLTSDEIAEQSIIIEQMLEKQNNEERLI